MVYVTVHHITIEKAARLLIDFRVIPTKICHTETACYSYRTKLCFECKHFAKLVPGFHGLRLLLWISSDFHIDFEEITTYF